MKNLLGRWFGGARPAEPPPAAARETAVAAPPLVFRADATFPIVEWNAMDAHAPAADAPVTLDAYWTAVARAWLEAIAAKLGGAFGVRESERFLLLSALDERASAGVLSYAEKTRKRILRVLEGAASESESGKLCLLVFADHDQYYHYVSNYGRDGEYSLSSGTFLQYGYGHFVFVQDHLSSIEPIIAHELTHCMLQHLPIPAWLNEGIAVNTEHRLSPPLGRPLYGPEEMHAKHLAFWNPDTIQEFWSGKSWRRQDDGNMLSYDLATHFVTLCAQDFAAFRAFVNTADLADSGDAAAREHLGYPVAHLAQAVLGEGAWAPNPEKWSEGVEHGQFRVRRSDPCA